MTRDTKLKIKRAQQKAWQTKQRQILRGILEHYKLKYGCCGCPEDDPVCMDFHHIKPEEKSMRVAKMVSDARGVKALEAELQKCAVVCANCHRKLHAGKEIALVRIELGD